MPLTHAGGQTRREILAGLGAVSAGMAVSFADKPQAECTKKRIQLLGRVLASDAHSHRDGTGLAGVMVSNGRDVVVTDANGAWELTAEPEAAVFVIKPPGWTYLENAGVPLLSSSGAAQSGSLDFRLRPQSEQDAFEVALFADTQAANAQELDYVRREIARSVPRAGFAFVINHGDVMGDDLRLLTPYKDIVRETGLIWHHCPGNHDMDLASPSHAHAFDTWKREIGPAHYAFQYANATFIVLNNVEYLGAGAQPLEGRLYRGALGEEQLTFVGNVLKHTPRDNLVVLSMHVPLVSFENPKALGDNTADRAQLLRLLSEFPNTVSFSGHSHTTEHHYLGREDGFAGPAPHHHHVLTAFCGSWWGGPLNEHGIPVSDSRDGSPRGYHVLRVEGNTYKTRFVPVGCLRGTSARTAADSEARLTVDVFDGGPKTRIRCHAPGADSTFELQRTVMPDPHIVESYARHRDLLKPWVSPAPSSHMWSGTLPQLSCGDCVLEITDEYGFERRLVVQV
jgi:hypothetical protein